MKALKTALAMLGVFLLAALALSATNTLMEKAKMEDLQAGMDGKIDSQVRERLSQGDPRIPILVIFEDDGHPDFGDLEVKYSYHLINGVAATGSSDSVERLAQDEAVSAIYLDADIKAAVPVSEDGNSLDGLAGSPATLVNASRAWEQGIDGKGMIVAVLDSGIDKNHPDLAGKVVGEVNFVQEEDTTRDLLGHGTLCAGIIAGSGTVSGGKYKGIAPGASLLNVRVIGSDGNGKVSDIIAGIEWALDNNAQVISLSLAGLNLGETNPPVTMAADKAMDSGVVVCAAAGNNG